MILLSSNKTARLELPPHSESNRRKNRSFIFLQIPSKNLTRDIRRIYKGYTKDIQRIYKGYRTDIQALQKHLSEILETPSKNWVFHRFCPNTTRTKADKSGHLGPNLDKCVPKQP
jgi:hypothetical protein